MAAIVVGVLSLLVFPLVLAPLSVVLASVALSRGEPLARAAMAVGVVAVVAAIAFTLST